MNYKLLSPAILLIFLVPAVFMLNSCTGKEEPASAPGAAGRTGTFKVASSIVYDVEVLNPYPDDAWTEECLKSLDHKSLVDFVFRGIYSGRFSAYDIFEGTPVSGRKIRRMEEKGEFSRDRIGKFQFREEWILDTLDMSFTKKVTEIRMGLQKFNGEGELTGYGPLFRVVL